MEFPKSKFMYSLAWITVYIPTKSRVLPRRAESAIFSKIATLANILDNKVSGRSTKLSSAADLAAVFFFSEQIVYIAAYE